MSAENVDPYRANRQFERQIFRGVPEGFRRPKPTPLKSEGEPIGTIIYDHKNETITFVPAKSD